MQPQITPRDMPRHFRPTLYVALKDALKVR
jgi:hypothetical protein